MTISFSGLASGLDTSSWITSLTALKQAKVSTLQQQKENVLVSKNTLSSIKSFFSSFRSTIEKITDTKFNIVSMDIFAQNLATSTNVKALTATATSEAVEGKYDVKVDKLASNTQAVSKYNYMTTITETTTASNDSLLRHLGVSAGKIYVTHDGQDHLIRIDDDETIGSFVEKLKDRGIDANFDERTGTFSADIGANNINDTMDNTGIVQALHLSSINKGYVSGSMKLEKLETYYEAATGDTKLSDLGVNIGKLTLQANDGEYEVLLEDGDKIQDLIDALNSKGIGATIENGVFTLKDAKIVADGTTNFLSAFGMSQSGVSETTQKSGNLSVSSVLETTTVADEDTLLSELNTGEVANAGQTVVVSDDAGNETTITLVENMSVGSLLSAMTDAGLTASIGADGKVNLAGGKIIGGTYDAAKALGLNYEIVAGLATGSPLTETLESEVIALSTSKLVEDLGIAEGYFEVTDSSGTAHYLKVESDDTVASLMSDIQSLGLGATYDSSTGVMTLTGGEYRTLTESDITSLVSAGSLASGATSTDLLAKIFGASSIPASSTSIGMASTKSEPLMMLVPETVNATGTSTLASIGVQDGVSIAEFDVNGSTVLVTLNSTMTINEMVAEMQAKGLDASFDETLSELRIQSAILTTVGSSTTLVTVSQTATYSGVVTDEQVYSSAAVGALGLTTYHFDEINGTLNADGTISGGTIVGVSTAADLLAMRAYCANNREYEGIHFIMTNDIDLGTCADFGSGIALNNSTFDGHGYRISGDVTFGITNSDVAGFFSCIKEGSAVQNLSFEGRLRVRNGITAGMLGFIGASYNSTIANVELDGVLVESNAATNLAGLVASAVGTTIDTVAMKDCQIINANENAYYVGGLVAFGQDTVINNVHIMEGQVANAGSAVAMGGMIGYSYRVNVNNSIIDLFGMKSTGTGTPIMGIVCGDSSELSLGDMYAACSNGLTDVYYNGNVTENGHLWVNGDDYNKISEYIVDNCPTSWYLDDSGNACLASYDSYFVRYYDDQGNLITEASHDSGSYGNILAFSGINFIDNGDGTYTVNNLASEIYDYGCSYIESPLLERVGIEMNMVYNTEEQVSGTSNLDEVMGLTSVVSSKYTTSVELKANTGLSSVSSSSTGIAISGLNDDTTLASLGINTGTVVFNDNGKTRTVTLNTTTYDTVGDLKTFFKTYGFEMAVDTQGRLNLFGKQGCTISDGTSNVMEKFGTTSWSTDSLSNEVTVWATGDTKLSELGLKSGDTFNLYDSSDNIINPIILNDPNTTINDFFVHLRDNYGIDATIENGVINFNASEYGYYIKGGSGAELLGFATTSSTNESSTLGVTYTQAEDATMDNTLAELGLSNGAMFVCSSTGLNSTISFGSSASLQAIANILDNYGMMLSISDGKLTLESTDGYYVYGSLADALGITAYRETVINTLTSSAPVTFNKDVITYNPIYTNYSMVTNEVSESKLVTHEYTARELAAFRSVTEAMNETGSLTNSTYKISTTNDLAMLSNYVNSGNDCSEITFILANDIDMTGYTGWTPIGSLDNPFSGTFNGNSYTISNLSVSGSYDKLGLFGYALDAEFSNVELKDFNISNTNNSDTAYTGALVGLAESVTIENIAIENSAISGYSGIGGIAGVVITGTLSNCIVQSSAIVARSGAGGGLVGSANYLEVTDTFVDVVLTGAKYMGGLLGWGSVTTIRNSMTQGDINFVSNSGNFGFGGFIGGAGTSFDIQDSISTMNLNTSGSQGRVGGFIGCLASISTAYSSYCTDNLFAGTIPNPRSGDNMSDVAFGYCGGSNSSPTAAIVNAVQVSGCAYSEDLYLSLPNKFGLDPAYVVIDDLSKDIQPFEYATESTTFEDLGLKNPGVLKILDGEEIKTLNVSLSTTIAEFNSMLEDISGGTASATFADGKVTISGAKILLEDSDEEILKALNFGDLSTTTASVRTGTQTVTTQQTTTLAPTYSVNVISSQLTSTNPVVPHIDTSNLTNVADSDPADFVSGSTFAISSTDDIQAIDDLMTIGGKTLAGVTFILASDINLSSYTGGTIGEGKSFQGTFDGNGYTLSNYSGEGGLFSSLDGATVKNLTLNNFNIDASSQSGVLANSSSGNTTIQYVEVKDCNVNSSYGYAGGLIGLIDSGTTQIYNSSVTGNINAGSSNYVGGLVGGARTSAGLIAQAIYVNANLEAGARVGGLIGNGTIIAYNVVVDGTIIGSNYVGGVAGYALSSNSSNFSYISDAYFLGTSNGGAIAGSIKSESTIANCYTKNGESIIAAGSCTLTDNKILNEHTVVPTIQTKSIATGITTFANLGLTSDSTIRVLDADNIVRTITVSATDTLTNFVSKLRNYDINISGNPGNYTIDTSSTGKILAPESGDLGDIEVLKCLGFDGSFATTTAEANVTLAELGFTPGTIYLKEAGTGAVADYLSYPGTDYIPFEGELSDVTLTEYMTAIERWFEYDCSIANGKLTLTAKDGNTQYYIDDANLSKLNISTANAYSVHSTNASTSERVVGVSQSIASNPLYLNMDYTGLDTVKDAFDNLGYFESGGTYRITGIDDLIALKDSVELDYDTSDVTFILEEDITLNSTWAGISGTFQGTFDGNGHLITNESKKAVFSTLDGATIKNLSLELAGDSDIGVSGIDYKGGFSDVAYNSNFTDITVTGTRYIALGGNGSHFGFLTGLSSNTDFNYCYVAVVGDNSIFPDDYVGGLAGEAVGATTVNKCLVSHYAYGEATSTYGAFVGLNAGTLTIQSSFLADSNVSAVGTNEGQLIFEDTCLYNEVNERFVSDNNYGGLFLGGTLELADGVGIADAIGNCGGTIEGAASLGTLEDVTNLVVGVHDPSIASLSTTFGDLGLNPGNFDFQIGVDGEVGHQIGVNTDTTLDEFITDLNRYGIEAWLDNGIINIENTQNNFIFECPEELDYILMINSNAPFYETRNVEIYNSNVELKENVGYTMNLDTTLGDLGIHENTEIVADDGYGNIVTGTFTESSKILDLMNFFEGDMGASVNLGISGKIEIDTEAPSHIISMSDSLRNAINWDNDIVDVENTQSNQLSLTKTLTVAQTQVYGNITMDTKLSELLDSSNNNLGITDGILYAYKNGNRGTLAISTNDTLSTLAAKLSAYDITLSVQDGKISFSGSGDSYITAEGVEAGSASNLLNKLGISSWAANSYVKSSPLEATIDDYGTTNTNQKLVDLKDADGNSLGIEVGTFTIVSNGFEITETIDENTTLDDFMAKLTLNGINAHLASDGTLSLSAQNNTYLKESDGSVGSSNVVETLFPDWSIRNVYRTDSLHVIEEDTQIVSTNTKLADLNQGVYQAGYIKVTDIDGNETNLELSDDETIGSFIEKLNSCGFDASLNSSGQIIIQNPNGSTLSDYSGAEQASNILDIINIDTSSFENSGVYNSTAIYEIDRSDVENPIDSNTKLSDLGVYSGEYYIYSNGVRYTAMLSYDDTVGEFLDNLSSFGIQASVVKDGGNSYIKLVGNGDSYVASSNAATGTSNIVTVLFPDAAVQEHNYSSKNLQELKQDTVEYFAEAETFINEFDNGANKSAGSLAITVDGVSSTINIAETDTLLDVINKFEAVGVATTYNNGVLQLNGNDKDITIDQANSTSKIVENLGLTYGDNIGGYTASTEICEQTISYEKEINASVVNFADLDTNIGSMNISSGSLTIYRDGQKATVMVDSDETFEKLQEKIQAEFTDVNIRFSDEGYLEIYSSQAGVKVGVGATTDTSNFGAITGISSVGDFVRSSRQMYSVNGDTKIMDLGLFVRGDVTSGTFIVGDAEFNIDENTTLNDIIKQINSSAETNATAFWDSVDGKFVIKSRTSGASLINIENGTSNFAYIMGFTTEDGNLIDSAQEIGGNAEFSINGTDFTSTSNIISSDVSRIQGVTLDLKEVTNGQTVTVTIEKDSEVVSDAVSELVNAYNDLMTNVDKELAMDGNLNDQTTLKLIRNQIRSLMTNTFSGNATFRNLSAIGITTEAASSANISTENINKLYFDKDKFMSAYNKDSNALKELLVGNGMSGGVLNQVETVVEQALSGVSGYFASAENSYNTQIDRINSRIEKATVAVANYKARLESKFQYMDMMISEIQNQFSSFLST